RGGSGVGQFPHRRHQLHHHRLDFVRPNSHAEAVQKRGSLRQMRGSRGGNWEHAVPPLSVSRRYAHASRCWRACGTMKTDSKVRVVAQNRKARFNYQIGETFEAGIALTGTEVKSLRAGKATIAEAYADTRGGEIWLINSNISEYLQGGRFNHAPKRVRKLLLHRRQINKLVGAVEREGMTLVPLKLYFNEKGRAKLELALARGK